MNDTVHIACCFDRHLELPFLVLANSIKRCLKGKRKVVVYAFHSDPLVHDRAFSRSLDSGAFEVRFLPVQNQYEGLPVINVKTAAAYIRLMLPALLHDVKRVLYLDSDVIALRDVCPLYDADLEGHAVAAVLAYPLLVINTKKDWLVRVGSNAWTVEQYLTEIIELTDWKRYFNSGIMVMDLDRFRREGLAAEAGRFLDRTNGRRFFDDQDALNHVLDGAFAPLDPRWNVYASRTEQDFAIAGGEFADVAKLWSTDPWIMHYCTPGKPWSLDTPMTAWDKHFWREAAECEALPLLLQGYLKQCGERGLTRLGSTETLLALGKPALDKRQLKAHARKFRKIPEVSLAVAQIASNHGPNGQAGRPSPVSVPVNSFKNNGGTREDQALAFNLADAAGHLVYGPYLWYPPGSYKAIFEITLSPGAGGGQSRLVIEVTDDSNRFLAQRFLSVAESVSGACRELDFTATGRELFLEFRVFADGFTGGTLRFSGVSLSAG
jgi:lipopolysaccharide biosynthesis glycosyltransferase